MSDSYKQPPPVMERLVAGEASGMSVYDRKLKDFLLGNNDEPQDRIARQGAPSHRAQYRGQDLWKARDLSSRTNVGDAVYIHDQLDLAISGFFISV